MNAPEFVPFREPISATITRTGLIAIGIGLAAGISCQSPRIFLATCLGALWFSFVGHWVEMLWLEFIRVRIPRDRRIQFCARILFWFVWGALLSFPLVATANLVAGQTLRQYNPLIGGLGFVIIELVVHALLLARAGRPSVYDGRG
jgi:hypothetical protein